MGKSRTTTSRESTCRYIYTDGTLIEVFEEKRDGVHIGDTVDVTLGYCTVSLDRHDDSYAQRQNEMQGRIIIGGRYQSDGFLRLAKGGKITATLPSLALGSENTRNRGIPVQYVKLVTKTGIELTWTETPTVLSGGFTLQGGDEYKLDMERLAVGYSWGASARVWKITDLRATPKPVPPTQFEIDELARQKCVSCLSCRGLADDESGSACFYCGRVVAVAAGTPVFNMGTQRLEGVA